MTQAENSLFSPVHMPIRTPWQVTLNVWWALFIRETQQRTMAERFGWFWLIAMPVLMVLIMVGVRVVMLGKAELTIAGAEFIPWLIIGLLTFQVFRQTTMRSLNAVSQNRLLFSYRQLKPVDPVLVRCFIEFNLNSFVLLLFIGASLLLPFTLVPFDPITGMLAWIMMWWIGVGLGLSMSALSVLMPELKKIVPMLMMPLFLTSGVIIPLNFLPAKFLQWLLWNPLVHAIELSRQSVFAGYQPIAGVNWFYPWVWALALVSLGLLLHLRYERRLRTL